MALPLSQPDADADPGLWRQFLRGGPGNRPRPALFLDRDGVIVEEVDYLHRTEDIRLLEGAAGAIKLCNEAGIPVVIVTNQSGVARGYYRWEDFVEVQTCLLAMLDAAGARIDMALACAHHGDGSPPYDIADHPWRKPNPGMLLAAGETLNLDLSGSWIVGDTASDIAAGAAAGLAGGVHVLTGHGKRDRASAATLQTVEFKCVFADRINEEIAALIGLER